VSLPQSSYGEYDRADVLPFLPAEAKSFLDIGCARGSFGRTIRRERGDGVRLVGLEPIAEQAAVARRSAYDAVVEGYFPEALAGSDERFDCIVLNDVLEHMLDPWSVVADLRRLLAEDGRVVASIPSIQFLPVWLKVLRGRWDYVDAGTLDRTHVRFFTRQTMVEMFTDAGYLIERVEGINSMVDMEGFWRHFRHIRWVFGNVQWLQFVIVARPLRTA
jgi:2-polyprenyl-3-methyl-5-hydroxy-6-metoxy-1,4-benzoquinol methylase